MSDVSHGGPDVSASGDAPLGAASAAAPAASTAAQPPATPAPVSHGRPLLPPPSWPAALAILVAIAGTIGFVVFFVTGDSTPRIGGTLALALLGLGVALAYWGRDLSDDEPIVGRYPLPPEPDEHERARLADDLQDDVGIITRRRFLSKLLIAGVGLFGLSQVVLVGALGPRSRGLFSTAWTAGARLVTFDGRPITGEALRGGGFVVAFPEGHTDSADSQIVLLRLTGVKPLPGRENWSPQGFFAYSRVCTHAGCAVAQYADEVQLLQCPCHQSTFDVRDGARPVSGPAGRPLPQLPLAIDAQGFLVAQSDFDAPVGPGFWNIYE